MNFTPEIKFELKRLLVLSILIAFALTLFMLRGYAVGYVTYHFMLWNLFLAIIPYAIALVMLIINNYKATPSLPEGSVAGLCSAERRGLGGRAPIQNKWLKYTLIPLGGLWLLFFPNAPYLVTTYAHFSNMPFSSPLRVFVLAPWHDLVWYSCIIWAGVFAGFVSLEIVHSIIKQHFGKFIAWAIITVILFLSSWAIYLGRFIRLNSWDIFTNPRILLPHILLDRQRLLFVFIFGIFMLLVYIFMQIKREKNS